MLESMVVIAILVLGAWLTVRMLAKRMAGSGLPWC